VVATGRAGSWLPGTAHAARPQAAKASVARRGSGRMSMCGDDTARVGPVSGAARADAGLNSRGRQLGHRRRSPACRARIKASRYVRKAPERGLGRWRCLPGGWACLSRRRGYSIRHTAGRRALGEDLRVQAARPFCADGPSRNTSRRDGHESHPLRWVPGREHSDRSARRARHSPDGQGREGEWRRACMSGWTGRTTTCAVVRRARFSERTRTGEKSWRAVTYLMVKAGGDQSCTIRICT
jgi:hypothetical protein